jgi:imidazoleglycerol phosphate dehydratase HisB
MEQGKVRHDAVEAAGKAFAKAVGTSIACF